MSLGTDVLSQESYVSANGSTYLALRTLRVYMSAGIETSEHAGMETKVAR